MLFRPRQKLARSKAAARIFFGCENAGFQLRWLTHAPVPVAALFAEDRLAILALLIGSVNGMQTKDVKTGSNWNAYRKVDDASTLQEIQRKPALPAKRQR